MAIAVFLHCCHKATGEIQYKSAFPLQSMCKCVWEVCKRGESGLCFLTSCFLLQFGNSLEYLARTTGNHSWIRGTAFVLQCTLMYSNDQNGSKHRGWCPAYSSSLVYIWIAGGILAAKSTLCHCFMGCCCASGHFLCKLKGFEVFKGLPFFYTQVNGISKIQFSKKSSICTGTVEVCSC